MSDKVAVFDTTLRDGEQAAGTRLGSREKLMIARQLAQLNVDVIEAGYPASSPEDFEAVQLISREIDGPAICALSRAVPDDIEACGKALAKARRPRIHTGIGASDIHIAGKFQDERYGRTLGREESQDPANGSRCGQARAAAMSTTSSSTPRMPAAPIRRTCLKWSKPSSTPARPSSIFPIPPATPCPSSTAR